MKRSVVLLALAILGTFGLTSCSSTSNVSGSGKTDLFNGKDLSGWKAVSAEGASMDKVWSVREGVIVCQGTPLGFLQTKREFTNFRMEAEYRWAPGSKPGNSGLFSRIAGFDKPLPPCVEVQLMHGSAGDVLTLQGMKIATNQARFFHIEDHEVAGDVDGVKKTADAEKAAGEWNKVEILAAAGRYTVWVNGQLVNEVEGVQIGTGPVGLQSEGGEIHFRNVRIAALP